MVTPSKLTKEVADRVEKAGQAKYIEMWRCWTPKQLPLLKGNVPKVLFTSAPSTGKTALMEAKAFQCMEEGLNVLFCLPLSYYNKARTLLSLKMEQHWQRLQKKHQWTNEFQVCSLGSSGAYAYRARTNTSFIICRVTTFIDLVKVVTVTRFDDFYLIEGFACIMSPRH